MSKVKSNVWVADNIYKLVVEGDFKGRAGQFYMLRCWEDEPLLSRPVSIHGIGGGYIEFLYAVVGRGTELLKRLRPEDDINLVGPLGNGFDIDSIKENRKIAVVTGGIGIAPMYKVIKDLKDSKSSLDINLYAGFKSESGVKLCEDVEKYAQVYIATEDGTAGQKGFVTEGLNPELYDMVLCCGPEVMMYKVIEMCRKTKTPIFISEEKKMACGVGACLVCTCKTKYGNKRTCKDGPVFNGDDIDL